jgi:hypothetical protein
VVSREVKGLAASCGFVLFFAIVDRVNLDFAGIVRGFALGGFGGVQVLMNESNFERRFRRSGIQGSGIRDQESI